MAPTTAGVALAGGYRCGDSTSLLNHGVELNAERMEEHV